MSSNENTSFKVIDQVFKQVLNNRYLIRSIFGHIRSIHRQVVANKLSESYVFSIGYLDSFSQVYDHIGSRFSKQPIFSTVVKEKVALCKLKGKEEEEKEKVTTITLSKRAKALAFFNFYENVMGPQELCQNPNIDLETFKQLIPLVRPRVFNPLNRSIMYWTISSRDIEKIKYLEELGYRNHSNQPPYRHSSLPPQLPPPSSSTNPNLFNLQSLYTSDTWMNDNNSLEQAIAQVKIHCESIIKERYQQTVDDYFQSLLLSLFQQYNKYQLMNNLEPITIPQDPSTWFTQEQSNLLFVLLVIIGLDKGLFTNAMHLVIKKLILFNNPIITTHLMTMQPDSTNLANIIIKYSLLLPVDSFTIVLNHYCTREPLVSIQNLLGYFFKDSLLQGDFVSARTILMCGKIAISSIRLDHFLKPIHLDGCVKIALEFFSRKENEFVNQKMWSDIYKMAALTSRNDIMESFFTTIDTTDKKNNTLITDILGNCLKGGNYSLALRIKELPCIDDLATLNLFMNFCYAIPTLCSTRVSDAVDFIVNWQQSLITWNQVIISSIYKQRVDVLLKLSQVGILNKDNPLHIGQMVIRHTAFLLECLEVLPSNCFSSSGPTPKHWKMMLKKAYNKKVSDQVIQVFHKYFQVVEEGGLTEYNYEKIKRLFVLHF
ncbi:hypothetical protein DFA_12306 [Cavenderia fasciculata]|uniref:Uncharacterized protein n=1 Tax=Cavenderia fasciculata TaxID=261658 RepID=F4QD59_CACFS|nr:uncharacterized protein DFA_12306 [Cavenderia fasciculata]EGG14530.1 hypothetical protein DFA_12306 [Cavenderia fasciculata]|eukprot:XP_004353963.1 hypothetical protein DFA_12306 [Cavenderia fasciculata]